MTLLRSSTVAMLVTVESSLQIYVHEAAVAVNCTVDFQ